MKKELIMPVLGVEAKAMSLVSWEIAPGNSFVAGDVLYEVESDKVVSQVEAEDAGIMSTHLVFEGDKVEPGTVVAEYESVE